MTAAAIWWAEPMGDRQRVLILGGTAEAVDLANRAAEQSDVSYSLAGRTRDPALPRNVSIRKGGFGGADAMADWMRENGTDAVIDATHPFAAQIARNALTACTTAGVPRLKLRRVAWQTQPDDTWLSAADVTEAASLLSSTGRRAFLSVGRQEISAFAPVENTALVARSIDPPDDTNTLPAATFITGRGPFSVSDEIALLRHHDIDVLVSKNAGGDATYAKIAAARELGITVIMIERPPVPPGEITESVETALAWLNALSA
jgi:precorrin-6A/cobalt-precorrin-6A reductase